MTFNEPFSLEEYRVAKERINKNEERRYQLLVLNITGFAAVFGFSDKIVEPVIPIALLGILIICSLAYSLQTRLQHFMTAYISERYEKNISSIMLETGYYFWSKGNNRSTSLMRKIIGYFSDPFSILCTISLVGGAGCSYRWFRLMWNDNQILLVLIYSYLIVCGHLLVYLRIKSHRGKILETSKEWWKNYLVSEGINESSHNKANTRAQQSPNRWDSTER